MKKTRITLVAALTCMGLAASASAQNLLGNPGFEDGDTGWTTFIPEENAHHDLSFEVSDKGGRSGRSAAVLRAPSEFSRFAIVNRTTLDVIPGDRYRLSLWYRTEPGSTVESWAPGLVLRATFFSKRGESPENIYVGPGGDISTKADANIRLPELAQEWTRVSAAITIPEGADRMQLNVFLWGMKGILFVDDVIVEHVTDETAPSR